MLFPGVGHGFSRDNHVNSNYSRLRSPYNTGKQRAMRMKMKEQLHLFRLGFKKDLEKRSTLNESLKWVGIL